ncbi:MAG: DNA-3-methyladenine glycosylase [Candidatus Eremiobacteraeota bacterium]|nr:DNA-3-methyladenine glycosylase [Candidatus Eremiobacteraeota bacterium]
MLKGNLEKFILPESFYNRDTVAVAHDSLGKILLKKNNGIWSGGMIVEAEAYLGQDDPASHASRKITPRNKVMFGPVGNTYVYLIYGMYHCFNLVAYNMESRRAGAVLIRAIEPLFDMLAMKKRRNREKIHELTNGPGKMCQALDITKADNGKSLQDGDMLVIENRDPEKFNIVQDTRIGIKEGVDYPFRFYISENLFVSRKARKKSYRC